jgi:hypothetical protein
MIGPHVRGQQGPTAVRTDILDSLKHYAPARLFQGVWGLIHKLAVGIGVLWVHWQESVSRKILIAVNRTCFPTVQVPAVAREGNEVAHAVQPPLPHGRGSVTSKLTPSYALQVEFKVRLGEQWYSGGVPH